MTQDISKEVLALSIHVAAAASQITIQTQQRMTLVTNSVLDSVDQTLKIINQIMMHSQKQSHLDAVIEEIDDDYGKDSKTKECYIDQQQNAIQNERLDSIRIENSICQENCNPNISIKSTSSSLLSVQKSKSNSQIIEEHPSNQNISNDTPMQKKKQSLLSQQLSQIKVDKVKEAQEQKELMLLIEQVDPQELITKLKSIEMLDTYQQENTNQMESIIHLDEPLIIQNAEQGYNEKKSSPKKSEWYNSSSVEYKATSYNTNESSNLDHHSYKWKSSSIEDENLLQDCDFQFQSSVFDFPFPEDFCTNSINVLQNFQQLEKQNQFTPKKKRLYCNNKKVPHWAENLQKVQQYQSQQQHLSQHEIFGKMKDRVLEIAKQFSENRYQRRGSSAQWQIPKQTFDMMQNQMKKLQQIQDQNIQKFLHKKIKAYLLRHNIFQLVSKKRSSIHLRKIQNIKNEFKFNYFSNHIDYQTNLQISYEQYLEYKQLKLYMFNFKTKYQNSQGQRKFEQLFEAYFDPENQNKTSSYLSILKKNKQIRFLTRAFVFTFPIVFGLYLLPGNQFMIQIEIKKFVRKSIVQFYKFIYDYSDLSQKSAFSQQYILALNQQYMYFDEQQLKNEGMFQDIIKQYIFILNEEDQNQLEFALLHLDELFSKVLEQNRYHYFIENTTLLIDLLDILARKVPDLNDAQLQFKYQFEVQKLEPITTLFCALFQYCLKQNERIEIYQYCIMFLKKNLIMALLLKQQLNLLLPIFYKDLAIQDDQINLITIKFLIEFQKSLQSSDLLDKLLKDQLFSNLISVLDRKSAEFRMELLNLIRMVNENQETCYLMKETKIYEEEKIRLQNLKVNKELQMIIKQLIQ
ncbi:unnamed protein product [Paramecium sonneborni]|uniref:Uncharacterized protein n=1 Tax=Paramecium sonneborni TaxID=65129 RepID=A0A8S1MVI5_9CILI|nr:unnamed protein product [Paramecium sonneborni]